MDTSIRNVPNPGAGNEPLQGTYRYVKVLLLNPASLRIGENQLNMLEYEAMYNPMTNDSYAVTRISDMILYTDGEGTPTLDLLVDPSTDTPSEDDPAETTAGEADTANPDESETESLIETHEFPRGGCGSVISVASVLSLCVASAAVCLKKKEE